MDRIQAIHDEACTCHECEEEYAIQAHFHLLLLGGLKCISHCLHYRKYYLKNPMRDSVLTGHQWVWELWNGNDRRFFQNMRMRKPVLRHLISSLVSSCGLDASSKRVTVEESLAIFLLIIGQGCTYPVVEERVQRSSETISNHFHMVLKAVCKLGRSIVRPTDESFSTIPEEIRSNANAWPYFKDCVGAIDGTHIVVHVPEGERTPSYNRKGSTTTNVLAICDFKMCITFAQVGLEGAMHDSRALTESWSNTKRRFPFPPTGKYYLGDAGYPLIKGFLTPYRGTRYHLPEFRANRNLQNPKEYFNYRHSSLRSVIERTFGILKRRWRVLTNMSMVDLDTQFKIIWACITIHNFIRRYDDEDLQYLGDLPAEDSELSSILRKREREEWFKEQRNETNAMEAFRDNLRDGIFAGRIQG